MSPAAPARLHAAWQMLDPASLTNVWLGICALGLAATLLMGRLLMHC